MMKKSVLLFFLLVVPAVLLCYAVFIEREWVERTEYRVPCHAWQGEELRIAVLTDLHARPNDGEYIDRIVMAALAARPHAVVLLGDFLNHHQEDKCMPISELEAHLRPLAALPCYAVLGNHDYTHGEQPLRAMLARLGVQCVEGKSAELIAAGGKLDIGGIRCCYTYDAPDAVPQPRDGVPLLLLSHTPVGAQFAHPQTLLTVCGHTHGGQVCWPWGGAVWMAEGKTPKEWAQGPISVQGRPCYVSRGLGTSCLPLRFCCRPELLLLRINSQ